VVVR
jgi:hypothetical protein